MANKFKLNKRKYDSSSDEEDADEDIKTMQIEKIKGQEDCHVDFEEGSIFTPFNLKNEFEEGIFDEDGTYIFKVNKDNEEIKDGWIDGIDWSKVKEMERSLKEKEEESEKVMEKTEEKIDEISIMESMLTIMLPKETVAKAIKRLNYLGGTVGAWQIKKKAKLELEKKHDINESKQHLSDLISYADKLLSIGELDIYQETYESLKFKLSKKSKPSAAVDEIDIFGSSDPKPTTSKQTHTDNVQWEFKWTQDSDEVHGPYSSQQMLAWQEDGYFRDGVLVKKLEEGSKVFYSSRRIDFGLYV